MKRHLFSFGLLAVSLLGMGCMKRPATSTPPPIPPVRIDAPSSTISIPSSWTKYENTQAGIRFFYPSSSYPSAFQPDESLEFNLNNEPLHPHVERSLYLKMAPQGSPRRDALPCLTTSNWPSKVQFNNLTFSTCITEDAGAGNRYRNYHFITTKNNLDIDFTFFVHYLGDIRIVGGCESGTSTKLECQPFNETTDTKVFTDILSTAEAIPITNPSTYQFETKTIQQTIRNLTIDVDYPVIARTDNQETKNTFNQAIYNKTIQPLIDQITTDYKDVEKDGFLEENSWDLTLHGTLPYQTPRLINVFFTGSQYTGGAHPNAIYQNIFFDTVLNQSITVKDLFTSPSSSLEQLATWSREQLSSQDNLQDIFFDEDWFKAGTVPNEENYALAHFTNQGLVITFPPYQIAAYAAGPQQVTIPWKNVRPLLKTKYQIE